MSTSRVSSTTGSYKYEEVPMLKEDQEDISENSAADEVLIHSRPSSSRRNFLPHILAGYCINIFLILFVIFSFLNPSQECRDSSLSAVYSPAQDVIEYGVFAFPESTEHKSQYQGNIKTGIPTDETDKLWSDLFEFGMQTYVDEETAKKLPHRTLAHPDDPTKFLVQLDVFHQLHCLNLIRGLLWPERYPDAPHTGYLLPNGQRNYTSSGAKHYDHCLEYLRQSIMCHSDISVVYWDWTEGDAFPSPHELEKHTCRRFDKVQDWARERQVPGTLNWPNDWKYRQPPDSAYSILEH